MPHSSIRSRPTRPDQPRPAKSCSHGGIFMILRTKLSRRCDNASLWNRPICDRSENERHELSLASPDSPGILQDEQGQAEQQDRQCTENRHRKGKRPVVPEAFTAHVGKPHQAIRRHGRSQPDNRDQDLRHVHYFHLRRRPAKPYSRKKWASRIGAKVCSVQWRRTEPMREHRRPPRRASRESGLSSKHSA